jgi:hypothetical protein
LIHAQDLIQQSIELIYGSVSGLEIESRIHREMIASLHQCADHTRNPDYMNIEDVIAFIIERNQLKKMFPINDDFESSVFNTIEEAELYLDEHSLDLEIIEVNIK